MPTHSDMRMQLYKTWLRRERNLINWSKTPLTDMFSRAFNPALRMAWILPHQPNGKNLSEIITWCNRHQCGPEDHILLWCVWERPDAASQKQTTASHSSPVWITVYLDRKAVRLYNIICCSMSATHLWLWQNEVCVFPDGQVSKNGHKLKPKRLGDRAQPRKPLLLWAEASNALSSWKNRDLFNLK